MTTACSYTVKAGDCLYRIAGRLTGDPERWPELYLRNARRLRSGRAELIYPGERLCLPSNWRRGNEDEIT